MFKNKAFKLLVLTRISINVADSLFYITTIWYISSVSPFLTGLAVLCFTLPENMLVFIGPVIDRSNPKKLLMTCSMFQFITITLIVMVNEFNLLNSYLILPFIVISTFLSASTYPIEETMVPQMVDNSKLVKANSVIEVAYKIVDFLFNGLSGILVSILTISVLYRLNLILFSLPLVFINLIAFKHENVSVDKFNFKSYKKELIEGVTFLAKKKYRNIIIPIIVINFFFVMTTVGMPFLARGYNNSEVMFGVILCVSAVGGFCGAIYVNYLNRKMSSGKVITYGLMLQGSFWVLMIIFSNTIMFLPLLFVSYVFFGSTNIMFASIFQHEIPIEMLGRASATIDTAITIAMPMGAIVAGVMLNYFSVQYVLILYGITAIIVGVLYRTNDEIFGLKIDNRDKVA
jgi:MFS family permease